MNMIGVDATRVQKRPYRLPKEDTQGRLRQADTLLTCKRAQIGCLDYFFDFLSIVRGLEKQHQTSKTETQSPRVI